MKIAIFGATGNTGLELVRQALYREHEVTAIVRNETKLEPFKSNPKFKAVTANILDSTELVPLLRHHDCVLSALGVAELVFMPVSLCLDSMKAIVQAMNQAEIKRLICVTSFYTKPNDKTYPWSYTFLVRPRWGRQIDDQYRMEQFLMEESKDIDYTIVRPPRLTDGPIENMNNLITNEDAYHFPDTFPSRICIPRTNLAHFMLDILTRKKFIKKAVAIDFPSLKVKEFIN